jgi:hypothetical protein
MTFRVDFFAQLRKIKNGITQSVKGLKPEGLGRSGDYINAPYAAPDK